MKKTMTVAALLAASAALSGAATVVTFDSDYSSKKIEGVDLTQGITFKLDYSFTGNQPTTGPINYFGISFNGGTIPTSGTFSTNGLAFRYIAGTSTAENLPNPALVLNANSASSATSGYTRNGITGALTGKTSEDGTTDNSHILEISLSFTDTGVISGTYKLDNGSAVTLSAPTNTFTLNATGGNTISLHDLGETGMTFNSVSVTYSPVPEPSAFGLLAGAGVLALAATRRRRK